MSTVVAGSGLRRQAQQRTRDALLRPQVLVISAVVLLGVVLAMFGSAELSGLIGHPWSPVIVAFVLGVSMASAIWALLGAVLLSDGSWSWRVGALGERSTAEVLGALGGEWTVEHNIPFWFVDGRCEWDIDHVLIGPGGVVVLDTKWVSEPIDLLRSKMRARIGAEMAALLGRSSQIAKEVRSKAGEVTVTSALVVWGPHVASADPSAPVQLNGVSVVPGADLVAWLEQLPPHPLSPDAASAAAGVLTKRITDHQQWRSRRCADAAGRGRS
jgi:hypothetical protein